MSQWCHIFRMTHLLCALCCVYCNSTMWMSTYVRMRYPEEEEKRITTTAIKRLTYSVGCGNDINSKCRLHENLLFIFALGYCASLLKLNFMRLIVSHCIPQANETYGYEDKEWGSSQNCKNLKQNGMEGVNDSHAVIDISNRLSESNVYVLCTRANLWQQKLLHTIIYRGSKTNCARLLSLN